MATKPTNTETGPDTTITLVEFCTRLSESVRRPEMIAAFEHSAKKSGLRRATWAEFKAQFDLFLTLPA